MYLSHLRIKKIMYRIIKYDTLFMFRILLRILLGISTNLLYYNYGTK